MIPLLHWINHIIGADYGLPYGHWSWYNIYSGIGGSVLLNLIAFLAVFWWHHQCAVTGCFWYARRSTAAGERACWKHHPHKKRTIRDLHDAHRRATNAGSKSLDCS